MTGSKKFRLHPLQRLLYLGFRLLAWLGSSVYFRRRLVLGREHFRAEGPLIVICNHPSTLLDVLNVGMCVPRPMFFLANYGLFKHPVSNWLFRRLFCIPVKRREDVGEGESRSNEEAFLLSFQHLEKGGVLFIAPEGASWMNRFVRPFKTGAARIALAVVNRHKGGESLRILPVGLSYTAPYRFRSDVVIQAGEPVEPAQWLKNWETDKEKAAQALTDYLQRRVEALCIHTGDEEGEIRLAQMEKWIHPAPLAVRFRQSQAFARLLHAQHTGALLGEYSRLLTSEGVTDETVTAFEHPATFIGRIRDFLVLTLGFPLCAIGLAWWSLACLLPWWVNRRLGLYVGYTSTVHILVGLFVFPLMIALTHSFAGYWLENEWGKWPVALGVFFLGLWVEVYIHCWKQVAAWIAWKRMPSGKKTVVARCSEIRKEALMQVGTPS